MRWTRGLIKVSGNAWREGEDQTYRFRDVDIISTSFVGNGRGRPPGIVGEVCMADGGGPYPWGPFTGVIEAPEKIPLALRDANISPRLADKDGADKFCEVGGA